LSNVKGELLPKFYFKISTISHTEFCGKRSKIETFSPQLAKISFGNKSAIAEGNRLHANFSRGMIKYKSFDANLVKSLLSKRIVLSSNKHKVFQKQIEDIILKGMYDDLYVIQENGKKYVALIELKTTSKKYMWTGEVKAAIRQLQLYQWLLKDELEAIGYPLYKESLLLIYSQNTGEKLREIKVPYDSNIEEWIKDVKAKFLGLSKLTVPHYSYCKLCPNQIKVACDWYKGRSAKTIWEDTVSL
jgi:hypothetical protein